MRKLLPLLVATGGLAVFTVAAVALSAAGYAQGPPGLVWTGRGTLSHLVAPPRERAILLAAIGMLAACLVAADVMCVRHDRRCLLRLGWTVLGVAFLFATICVDIRSDRTLHHLLFAGFMFFVLCHGITDLAGRHDVRGRRRQGIIIGMLLAVAAVAMALRRRYRSTVAWAEVALFPLTVVLVLGCYV